MNINIIKYANKPTNPIGFNWFNERFKDGFFLDLLNHIFPLSLFIAHKYNISAKVLVNRSLTYLYNSSIEESKGNVLRDLKKWFIILQDTPLLEPIDQYYLHILRRCNWTYSIKSMGIEDQLIKDMTGIGFYNAGREMICKGKIILYERNINVFHIDNNQLAFQPESVISNSANRYFNSFTVYDNVSDIELKYLDFINNIASIIDRSKDVTDLIVLNSSYRTYAQGNGLLKDKGVRKMCRHIKKSFATNF